MIKQRTGPKRQRLGLASIIVALLVVAVACGSGGATASEPELASIEDSSPGEADSTSDDDSEGGEDSTPATSAPSTAPEDVDPDEVFARFEACMAKYGVEVSFGGSGGAPVPGSDEATAQPEITDFEDLEEAQKECDPILDEAFGSFDLSPEDEAEQADQMLALQLCLADEGFEIDMQSNRFQLPQDVDFDEFNAAMTRCDAQTQPGVADSDS